MHRPVEHRLRPGREPAALLLLASCLFSSGLCCAQNSENASSERLRPARSEIRTPELISAATNGDRDAQLKLGYSYFDRHCPSDEKKEHADCDNARAFEWLLKSARQGHPLAQNLISAMYGEGLGVKQDPAEAFYWTKKAAEQGDHVAQAGLGNMYREGLGVAQDFSAAAQWYRKAADSGDEEAPNSLGALYNEGKGVPKDRAEALRWFRIAADRGSCRGHYNLGAAYVSGDGVEQDFYEAAERFREAAGQDCVEAQYALAQMYESGHGVRQDFDAARIWARRAATQGNDRAKAMADFLGSWPNADPPVFSTSAAVQPLTDREFRVIDAALDGLEKAQDRGSFELVLPGEFSSIFGKLNPARLIVVPTKKGGPWEKTCRSRQEEITAALGAQRYERFTRLIEAALIHGDKKTKRTALLHLVSSLKDVDAFPEIRKYLSDPDQDVRLEAAFRLAECFDPGGRAVLDAGLASSDPTAVINSVFGLSALGERRGLEKVRAIARSPATTIGPHARSRAIRLLGQLQDEPSDELFRRFVVAPDSETAAAALYAVYRNAGLDRNTLPMGSQYMRNGVIILPRKSRIALSEEDYANIERTIAAPWVTAYIKECGYKLLAARPAEATRGMLKRLVDSDDRAKLKGFLKEYAGAPQDIQWLIPILDAEDVTLALSAESAIEKIVGTIIAVPNTDDPTQGLDLIRKARRHWWAAHKNDPQFAAYEKR